jgi:uncharacterized damage-inducible protein DinB
MNGVATNPEMRRMFDHMAWADRKLIDLLSASDQARQVPGVIRLLAHVVAAERVWLLRTRGEDPAKAPIWPDWRMDRIAATADANAEQYREALAGEPDRVVEYTNSKGTPFSTRLADILTHVALHGSYHRGQIAASLRAGGVEPVNTDYITYVRSTTA